MENFKKENILQDKREKSEQQKVNLSPVRRLLAWELSTATGYLQGRQREGHQPEKGKHQNSGKWSQKYAAEICFYLFRYWIGRMQKQKKWLETLRTLGSGISTGLISVSFQHWFMQRSVANKNSIIFTMLHLSGVHEFIPDARKCDSRCRPTSLYGSHQEDTTFLSSSATRHPQGSWELSRKQLSQANIRVRYLAARRVCICLCPKGISI